MATIRPPRIPKYRLHKPSGRAVVRLKGRDIYLGVHGTPDSRVEYQRVIAEWVAAGGLIPPPQANEHGAEQRATAAAVSIDELNLSYLAFAESYYIKNGERTHEVENIRDAVKPLVLMYGKLAVNDFGPSALKAVRQTMIDKGWSRSYTNSQINRIRRVFKWGVENELVSAVVLHGLQAVSPLKRGRCQVRETEPVRPVPEHLIEPVLQQAPPTVAAMIRLQLLTGMRPGEVSMIRTCDIDLTGPIWSYRPATHKTEHHGRNRVIYLGPRAQDVLRAFLKTELKAFVFSPADAMEDRWRTQRENRQTPLTPSHIARTRKRYPKWRPGDHYDRRSYAWAIYRACDRAFPAPAHVQGKAKKQWQREHRWSPNQLRHNAATLLRKQFGLEAARVVLGHSSATVTEIYAEIDLAKAADIMGRVG